MAIQGFTRITNYLYEAIMQTDFTKRQLNILNLVIRMSYGCGKESALLRPKDFELVGIHKADVRRELDFLDIFGVLDVDGENITINKYPEYWHVDKVRNVDQTRWQEVLRRNLIARGKQNELVNDPLCDLLNDPVS